MRRLGAFGYHALLLFSFLGVLFIPFSFSYLPLHSGLTKVLFGNLILAITSHFKGVKVANPEISSDATTLYLLLTLLLVLATLLAATVPFWSFWKKHKAVIVEAIRLILACYLSLIMLRYGMDKIFKAQFYLPEPNILFTPLGRLDKDIAYWSIMGTSRSYSIFMGCMEVLPAILILFRKTRVLGLFILLGVLVNVVLVNFSFDISVKLYSCFLLLVTVVLLAPFTPALFRFFVGNSAATLAPVAARNLIPTGMGGALLKTVASVLLFAETLLPYISTGQYNDDATARNYLHGAYEVEAVAPPLQNEVNSSLKRLFIHRSSYLIFQYADDHMEDFRLEIDTPQQQFLLTNYEGALLKLKYTYSEKSKTLVLKAPDGSLTIYSKALPWHDLPLLQPLFHWTVDQI